jgi:hypothetical protein
LFFLCYGPFLFVGTFFFPLFFYNTLMLLPSWDSIDAFLYYFVILQFQCYWPFHFLCWFVILLTPLFLSLLLCSSITCFPSFSMIFYNYIVNIFYVHLFFCLASYHSFSILHCCCCVIFIFSFMFCNLWGSYYVFPSIYIFMFIFMFYVASFASFYTLYKSLQDLQGSTFLSMHFNKTL